MSDYFNDVYNMRLNRYGNDYQSRILGQRQKIFQNLLLKSPNRVDFDYEGSVTAGILAPYKQNETKTLFYLLTEDSVYIPGGTILEIIDVSYNSAYWMVYWVEDGPEAGYNKYAILKMTHNITWTNRKGEECESWAYFYGQEDNMLREELRSRSRSAALYTEDLKLAFLIMPITANINKDDYFVISTETDDGVIDQGYVVTGYDHISTPGVEYVSVIPEFLHDTSPAPTQKSTDNPEDFFWLNGGKTND